jgi:hypothetical protein
MRRKPMCRAPARSIQLTGCKPTKWREPVIKPPSRVMGMTGASQSRTGRNPNTVGRKRATHTYPTEGHGPHHAASSTTQQYFGRSHGNNLGHQETRLHGHVEWISEPHRDNVPGSIGSSIHTIRVGSSSRCKSHEPYGTK